MQSCRFVSVMHKAFPYHQCRCLFIISVIMLRMTLLAAKSLIRETVLVQCDASRMGLTKSILDMHVFEECVCVCVCVCVRERSLVCMVGVIFVCVDTVFGFYGYSLFHV